MSRRGRGGEHFRVVRHDDERAAVAVRGELGDDLVAGGVIQRGGGLVGEDNLRLVHQGAGDGDPLALAPGELVRQAVGGAGEAERSPTAPARGRWRPVWEWSPPGCSPAR